MLEPTALAALALLCAVILRQEARSPGSRDDRPELAPLLERLPPEEPGCISRCNSVAEMPPFPLVRGHAAENQTVRGV